MDGDHDGTRRNPRDPHRLLVAEDDSRRVEVDVRPEAGGRIAQVVISEDDHDTALLAESETTEPWSSGWGSFPMAPWAGRVRHGRFTFLDRAVQLGLNHDDSSTTGGATIHPPITPGIDGDAGATDRRHSIHGTTFTLQWTVGEEDTAYLAMHCDLASALGWPFGGRATQIIEVTTNRIRCTLAVEATSEAFPASIGWHPWFAKPTAVEMEPLARYELDATALPTGRLVRPGEGPWDDCFVNRSPVHLHYDRAAAAVVTITSDCDHLVLYDRPPHATCVEPQSGPPDAPNVRPEVVGIGEQLRRTMTWAW